MGGIGRNNIVFSTDATRLDQRTYLGCTRRTFMTPLGFALDRVAVSIYGEHGQPCEAHGQRQECGDRPADPQRAHRGAAIPGGQVPLHLHLVGAVDRDVRKRTTQNQRPPCVPDCRVHLKTIRRERSVIIH